MRIRTLSNDNRTFTFVIESKDEALILDAGAKTDLVYNAINSDLTKVAGCLVSNYHNATYLREYAEDFNTVSNRETLSFLNLSHFKKVRSVKANNTYQIGNFIVYPFELKYNIKCFGYFINHAKTGRILYLPNTKEIPYKFNDMNHLIVECHYEGKKLLSNVKEGLIVPALQRRIVNSHLEFDSLKNWLKLQDISKLKNILLCNLSDKNSNPEQFKEDILLQTKINTDLAINGLIIDLKP